MNYRKFLEENLHNTPFSNQIICKNPVEEILYISDKSGYYKDEIQVSHFIDKNVFLPNTNKLCKYSSAKLVGTGHLGYIGLTWSQQYAQQERMTSKMHLENGNIDYYINPSLYDVTDDWYIEIINGDKCYIDSGNHRSCLAKYLSFFGIIPDMQTPNNGIRVIDFNEYELKTYLDCSCVLNELDYGYSMNYTPELRSEGNISFTTRKFICSYHGNKQKRFKKEFNTAESLLSELKQIKLRKSNVLYKFFGLFS